MFSNRMCHSFHNQFHNTLKGTAYLVWLHVFKNTFIQGALDEADAVDDDTSGNMEVAEISVIGGT